MGGLPGRWVPACLLLEPGHHLWERAVVSEFLESTRWLVLAAFCHISDEELTMVRFGGDEENDWYTL